MIHTIIDIVDITGISSHQTLVPDLVAELVCELRDAEHAAQLLAARLAHAPEVDVQLRTTQKYLTAAKIFNL